MVVSVLTGLFCGGAGTQPAWLWVQSEGREGVQHGPVHPATSGRGTCSQRWQDTCKSLNCLASAVPVVDSNEVHLLQYSIT